MSSDIASLNPGGAGVATDRIPVARSPFGAGDNVYLLYSTLINLQSVPGTDADTTMADYGYRR
jgi:hypothetical protein